MSCFLHVFGIAAVTLPTFTLMYIFDPDPFGTEMIDTFLWSVLYASILYALIYVATQQYNPGLVQNSLQPFMSRFL